MHKGPRETEHEAAMTPIDDPETRMSELAPQPDRPGVTIDIPVRWGDMDALGHVNNIVYFQYCESARIAYFDALDLDACRKKPGDGPGLVAANLNFRKQVRYPATLRVTTNVTAISRRSITFSFVLRDKADGSPVADGTSVAVWVDYELSQALAIPELLRNGIAHLEQNPKLGGSPA